MFYRRPEQMVLTFSLPAVICVLLGSIFSTKLPDSRDQHRRSDRGEHARLRHSFDVLHQLGHQHCRRSRHRRLAASARDTDHGAVVLHRKNLSRRDRQPCRGRRPGVGRTAIVFQLRLPATVFGWFTLTWVFVLGHRQLFAARHLHQQLRQQRGRCCRRHQRPGGRPAVRVGHIRAADGVADVDVGRGLHLSGQVDGPRVPVGAAAIEDGRLRTGRQLGTLAHIPGAERMDDRRSSRLPRRFPVVGQALIRRDFAASVLPRAVRSPVLPVSRQCPGDRRTTTVRRRQPPAGAPAAAPAEPVTHVE